jgi:hypothetical protein
MPLSDPIYNAFKFFIPPNWFYPSVVDELWPALKQMDLPYDSLEAYMNSTIINGILPGLKDEGSKEQTHSFGKTKTFKGSMLPKESVTKSLDLSFKLKGSFLNWIIMYKQMLAFLDHDDENQFMPPLYMHILDDYGNAIISLVYSKIRIGEVPPIDFTKQDRGILSRDFRVPIKFNEFNLKFNLGKTSNYTKPEFQY